MVIRCLWSKNNNFRIALGLHKRKHSGKPYSRMVFHNNQEVNTDKTISSHQPTSALYFGWEVIGIYSIVYLVWETSKVRQAIILIWVQFEHYLTLIQTQFDNQISNKSVNDFNSILLRGVWRQVLDDQYLYLNFFSNLIIHFNIWVKEIAKIYFLNLKCQNFKRTEQSHNIIRIRKTKLNFP